MRKTATWYNQYPQGPVRSGAESGSKQKHLSRAARHGTSCSSALKSFELAWMPLTEEIWLSLEMAYLLFILSFLSFHTSVLLSGAQMTLWEPRILGKFSAGPVGWVLLFHSGDWSNRKLLSPLFCLKWRCDAKSGRRYLHSRRKTQREPMLTSPSGGFTQPTASSPYTPSCGRKPVPCLLVSPH